MLMQATKTFVFKERRLASLIWLWGVLGTLIVSFAVDYLANSFVIGPSGYGKAFWLIPIYYFFTLFLSYRAYVSWKFISVCSIYWADGSIDSYYEFLGGLLYFYDD